jgi:hypothetical protein
LVRKIVNRDFKPFSRQGSSQVANVGSNSPNIRPIIRSQDCKFQLRLLLGRPSYSEFLTGKEKPRTKTRPRYPAFLITVNFR